MGEGREILISSFALHFKNVFVRISHTVFVVFSTRCIFRRSQSAAVGSPCTSTGIPGFLIILNEKEILSCVKTVSLLALDKARCDEDILRELLSNKRHAKPAKQSSGPVLCPLSLRGSNEMDVHSIALRVRIEINFDLWE